MGKINSLLQMRFKQKESAKITALAERSQNGKLSSFSGLFRVSALSEKDKDFLQQILNTYRLSEETIIEKDLEKLSLLTAEVRAITNQAVMLHGERIKKAQEILKAYQEGAFTSWLISTYGNRQTPYNFLQYYEFYCALTEDLQNKVESMPRQAVYTLASRNVSFSEKENIVKNFNGETKEELLTLIRQSFPLRNEDKRLPNLGYQSLLALQKVQRLFLHPHFVPNERQKKELQTLLAHLQRFLQPDNRPLS